jgi:hypothetical protein
MISSVSKNLLRGQRKHMDKTPTLPKRPLKTMRFTVAMDPSEYAKMVRLAERLDRDASEAVRYAIRRTLAALEAEEQH